MEVTHINNNRNGEFDAAHSRRSEFDAAHSRRRNLKRHIAVRFILITALSIPDRSLISITHQPLKRWEFEAAHSRPLYFILIIALCNPAVLLS